MSSIRAAIATAKTRLPLPDLLRVLGFNPPLSGEGNMPTPFATGRRQKSPSFSLFCRGGSWRWYDRTGGHAIKGDEITLLEKLENLSRKDAISRYLDIAGVGNAQGSSGCQQKLPPLKRDLRSSPAMIMDWSAAVAKFTADHAARLSKWRGYSNEFVHWLWQQELLGVYNDNLALPVHDDDGRVIAVHIRAKSGRWFYAPRGAGVHPLIIGDTHTASSTMIFESQWDAFAIMDECGWHQEEPEGWAVLITRGASNGQFAARVSGEIYAWPQNDPEKDGRSAGEEWLRNVAMHARGNVFRIVVPAKFKDANDWIRAES